MTLKLTDYQAKSAGWLAAWFGTDWFTLWDIWTNRNDSTVVKFHRPAFTLTTLRRKDVLTFRRTPNRTPGSVDSAWQYKVIALPEPGHPLQTRYYGPGHDEEGNEIPIVNQGWRVYMKSYHTHRGGQDIQRPRTKQLPRESLMDTFPTELEALCYAWRLKLGRSQS